MKGPERTSFLLPLRVPPGISRPNFVLLAAAAVRCTHETCTQVRFAMDSAVEGSGFEPSVPLRGRQRISRLKVSKRAVPWAPRCGGRRLDSRDGLATLACKPHRQSRAC